MFLLITKAAQGTCGIEQCHQPARPQLPAQHARQADVAPPLAAGLPAPLAEGAPPTPGSSEDADEALGEALAAKLAAAQEVRALLHHSLLHQ